MAEVNETEIDRNFSLSFGRNSSILPIVCLPRHLSGW
jgi:hypothetical protein